MAFTSSFKKQSTVSSPKSLFGDLRNRSVKGLLDHQSFVLDKYHKEALKKSNVALELPTGSGKTLVGLLIAEYRRRLFGEQVLYLCPTKQLVNQVVEHSQTKYGIRTHAFTGNQKYFNPQDLSDFTSSETIGVTTYSGLFNTNPFAKNPDVIILDDSHAAENYISDFWSVNINRYDNEEIYHLIVKIIKNKIKPAQFQRLVTSTPDYSDLEWVEKLPTLKYAQLFNDLIPALDEFLKETDLSYSWGMIRNNLEGTHLYLSYNNISIRPNIPPSLTHTPFSNAKQRIFMSATLGESGDLERNLGVKNIHRIEKPEDWDKQGLGRRLFFFPETIMEEKEATNFAIRMTKEVERSLVLVPNDKESSKIEELFNDQTDSSIFLATAIEKTKEEFVESSNAVTILSNRFDGIDFAEDECRLMIIKGTPTGTNLQEKFLVSRLAASVLYQDKVRTRLIQAVGRCTRSTVDYSAICILGKSLIDELVPNRKRSLLHPEMQAEIKFGYDESRNKNDKDELIENLNIFLERGEEWDAADEQILLLRDTLDQQKLSLSEQLLKAAKHEVNYQYAIWNGNYSKAIDECESVLTCIAGSSELKGYRAFWNYLAGSAAWLAFQSGDESYRNIPPRFFEKAANCTESVPWIHEIAHLAKTEEEGSDKSDYLLTLLVEGLERNIKEMGVVDKRKFEREAQLILNNLSKHSKFEEGHRRLGRLLGFSSYNTEEETGPDPWWVIGSDFCIVSEDKIYEPNDDDFPSIANKKVSAAHVRQASSHPQWIKNNEHRLEHEAKIIPVMITNAVSLEENARSISEEVYYKSYEDFLELAREGIALVRKLRQTFTQEGEESWRIRAMAEFQNRGLDPSSIIEKFSSKKLSEL
ncbi:DEAD/DEAH box helicase family protein [Halobacillus kuroshimensis]|uniref:DEAD/DEAH box helicase family protein n=1 Tax=Halobacillus kuroshimensis TaxID=302481 RepID=A0ABS3DUB0_9BACI|nr:DEAD/DEAH box helicase [Halobacillus kuroshimensis]MBN8234918.1 DEAD/DEAH box helicase family protein [Halobacillus kuroshimensis]